MKVNISRPIKDAAKDMVSFYFDKYHQNHSFSGLKKDILNHIDNCIIEAYATNKGSRIKINQKCDKKHPDASSN